MLHLNDINVGLDFRYEYCSSFQFPKSLYEGTDLLVY